VTTAEVCTPGWSSAHRDVTTAERHEVFAAYGIDYGRHTAYEVDHVIPLELGGDNSVRNLWPEPMTENDTAGPDKDALENHLHALVCDRQLSLATAQHAIATNWVGAWRAYEGISTQPRPTHAPVTRRPTPVVTHTSRPRPAPTTTNHAPIDEGVVHPGAFCAPEGASGHTDRGTAMVCGPASDGRNRWHHA
jgi:hypothetical protein